MRSPADDLRKYLQNMSFFHPPVSAPSGEVFIEGVLFPGGPIVNRFDDCSDFEDLLAEYSCGDDAEMTPAERQAVDEHLAVCERCRESLKMFRRADVCIRHMVALDHVEVPNDVLKRSRQRLDAMLKEKVAEMKSKAEAEARESSRPLAAEATDTKAAEDRPANVRRFPRWRIAAGIAASILIAVGVGVYSTSDMTNDIPDFAGHRNNAAISGNSQSTQKAPTLSDRVSSAKFAGDALSLLKDELENAKVKSEPSEPRFSEIIRISEMTLKKWGVTADSAEAWLLVSRSNTEMAKVEDARNAFLAYADAVDETSSYLDASDVILKEMDGLFRKKDYLESLHYCDVLMTRYPGTPVAIRARIRAADYYASQGSPDQAIKEYVRAASEGNETEFAVTAREKAALVLANAGRIQDAIEMISLAEASTSNDFRKAELAYFKATIYRGTGDYVSCLRVTKELLENFKGKNPGVESQAKILLASLNDRMLKNVIDDSDM